VSDSSRRSAVKAERPLAARGKRETVGKVERGLRVLVAVRKHLWLVLRASHMPANQANGAPDAFERNEGCGVFHAPVLADQVGHTLSKGGSKHCCLYIRRLAILTKSCNKRLLCC
jgi:hypothetical protein